MTIASIDPSPIVSDPKLPYLRTPEAAKYLGLGRSTLERYRITGKGPRYRVLGAKIIVYTAEDLDAFAQSKVRTSTTQRAA